MPHIPVNPWSVYNIGDPREATKEQLIKAVGKAAKAANQRLLRLERKGYTKAAYRIAMNNLEGRRRFYERPGTKKLSLNDLRKEYISLREFLSSKTSTVQGTNRINEKRYKTAQDKGFDGTKDEFERLMNQVWSEHVESLFSSDVIYKAVTSGTTEILLKVADRYKEAQETTSKGRALLDYYRSLDKEN